jgi:methyltransferase (TIGR00027 family)
MDKNSPIENVSDTAFWVAYYRAKESERPDALFQDRFAKSLIGERWKSFSELKHEITQYTEWSVISRTVTIDRFIEKLLKDGVDAVVNLGTGLDARPYRMNLPEKLEWIEVDYPSIIAHKTEVLRSEKPRCKLTRVEVDLADGKKRKAFLSHVAPQAKKVLILTEGVIPYLTQEQVIDLSKDLLDQQRFAFWITEYFDPKVYPYLKKTVRAVLMKNAPFRFYPKDWFGFFRKLGWVEKETRYSGEVALEFNRKPPMPKWVEFILPFFPRKFRDESLRMTGYVIFKRD